VEDSVCYGFDQFDFWYVAVAWEESGESEERGGKRRECRYHVELL
jgi:hypothetical protein